MSHFILRLSIVRTSPLLLLCLLLVKFNWQGNEMFWLWQMVVALAAVLFIAVYCICIKSVSIY